MWNVVCVKFFEFSWLFLIPIDFLVVAAILCWCLKIDSQNCSNSRRTKKVQRIWGKTITTQLIAYFSTELWIPVYFEMNKQKKNTFSGELCYMLLRLSIFVSRVFHYSTKYSSQCVRFHQFILSWKYNEIHSLSVNILSSHDIFN